MVCDIMKYFTFLSSVSDALYFIHQKNWNTLSRSSSYIYDRSIINRKAPTTYLGGILTQKRAKTAAQQQRGRQAGRQAGSSTAKRQN